jgi:phenylpropionate dioxygenase-like ring-hydroxylating dioxygenase large terminal subunit
MHGLPTEHYTSPALFERERERIFGRLWLFAGLKMMVSRSGAYYARTLAGRPIVLQNLGGEVGCFLNVCAHRNAQVQPEGVGVRAFVCGYHGFRYAIDGSVAQIPMEETHYRYTPKERCSLALRRFSLEQVGELLFVNFADDPLPIHEQFSPELLSQLAEVSHYFDTDLIEAAHTGRYNWKLPGENLRDLLHPRFVHPQSLFPLFDFERPPTEPRAPSEGRTKLREVSYGGAEGRAKKDFSWPWWNQLERWPKASEDYYNWLLFPNLHIASPDGCRTFGIEQYDPVDVGHTRLVHFMLTSRQKDRLPEGDALLRGMLRGARSILEEDTNIMESVQRSFVSGSPTMQLGAYEHDLHQFVTVTQDLLDD